jgi:hypothetical protein
LTPIPGIIPWVGGSAASPTTLIANCAPDAA